MTDVDVASLFEQFVRSIIGDLPPEAGEVIDRWQPAEQLLLVGGDLRTAQDGRSFENVDPATEDVLGIAPDAGAADMDLAIAAAREAFDQTRWAEDPALRRHCLLQLRSGLASAADELRATLVSELGAPVLSTYGPQIDEPLEKLEHVIELAGGYDYERRLPDARAMGQLVERRIRREPFGVAAAITPWNIPFELTIAKVGAALAAGNTVVLKPSPLTPWTATTFGRIVADSTDIPPGVVNVVTSSSSEVSARLVSDPRVDVVSFTGSTQTGRSVMAAAAPTIKKTILELGGKSASVVLDDAPLEFVVPVAASFACMNSGQGCVLSTRMLVPRSRYDECVDLARVAYEALAYGDPADPETLIGPVVSAGQRRRILDYVELGRAGGGSLLVGGGPGSVNGAGFYVEPTLFVDVDPTSRIAREEIFGPVLCVIPYEDDDDAVRIANSTVYGLAGTVFGSDRERAIALARRVRTGMIGINGASFIHADTPFGGYKQSGLGREWGVFGFEEFLETKALCVPALPQQGQEASGARTDPVSGGRDRLPRRGLPIDLDDESLAHRRAPADGGVTSLRSLQSSSTGRLDRPSMRATGAKRCTFPADPGQPHKPRSPVDSDSSGGTSSRRTRTEREDAVRLRLRAGEFGLHSYELRPTLLELGVLSGAKRRQRRGRT